MGVLLLMTIGLVLASAVLLVLGFAFNVVGYIYVAILCAVTAGIVLFVWTRLYERRVSAPSMDKGAPVRGASRRTAPRPRREMQAGPRPDPATGLEVDSGSRAELNIAGSDEYEEFDGRFEDEVEGESPSRVFYPAADSEDDEEEWDEPAAESEREEDWGEDWGDEIVFPIADYDDLRVSEIVPILPELDPDELEEVHDRESAGRARTTILDRIDELLGRRPARRPIVAARTQPSPQGRPAPARPSAPEASVSTSRRQPGAAPGSADPTAKAGRARKAAPPGKAAPPDVAPGPDRQAIPARSASTRKSASPSEVTSDRSSSSDSAHTRTAKTAAKPRAENKRDR